MFLMQVLQLANCIENYHEDDDNENIYEPVSKINPNQNQALPGTAKHVLYISNYSTIPDQHSGNLTKEPTVALLLQDKH